jgi:hypothetical protein
MKRICLCFTLCLLIQNHSPAQSNLSSTVVSDLSDSVPSFPIPKDILQSHSLFLLGEHHGVSVNPEIILKYLMFLYREAHTRFLIIEESPSEAFLYNKYLITGDETFVKECWDFRYDEYVKFWRALYAFNKTKAPDQKIEIMGLDFETDITFARAVSVLKPANAKTPALIKAALDPLDSILQSKGKPNYLSQEQYIKFKTSYKENKQLFRTYFGDYEYELDDLCGNKASFQKFKRRDDEMVNNFYARADVESGITYMGVFGSQHVMLNDGNNFATQLNREVLKNKVLTIQLYYEDCESFYKNKVETIKNDFFFDYLNKKKAALLEEEYKTHSPYQITMHTLNAVSDEGKIMSTHAQYLIYIKHKKAVTLIPR